MCGMDKIEWKEKKSEKSLKRVLTFVGTGGNIYKLSRDGALKRALKRRKQSTLENRINDLVKRIYEQKFCEKSSEQVLT